LHQLLRNQAVGTETAEHYATRLIPIEGIPRALISNRVRAGILRQQLGATVTTTQQPSEQRFTVFDRPMHRVTSRIVVMGNHRLVVLIDIPLNVTLVVIQDQYCPVFATALRLSTNPLSSVLKPHDGFAAPIRVGAGIDRVLQNAEHRPVPNRLPNDLAHSFCSASGRQLDLLLIQPEMDLPHATEFRKFAKYQIDGGPDPGIRIFLDAVVRSFYISDRNPPN